VCVCDMSLMIAPSSLSSLPRYPLSPSSKPNVSTTPPPLDLGPGIIKGEKAPPAETWPHAAPCVPCHAEAPPANHGNDVASTTLLTVAAGLQVRVGAGTPSPNKDDGVFDQYSPPLTRSPSDWTDSVADVTSAESEDAATTGSAEDEDEDAVMVLLSLQRVASQNRLDRLDAPLSAGSKRRAESPPDDSDGKSHYFCRFPGCGKGYASTDAVRKHCRQRHLEWLRQLGHGCPALYCRWGDQP